MSKIMILKHSCHKWNKISIKSYKCIQMTPVFQDETFLYQKGAEKLWFVKNVSFYSSNPSLRPSFPPHSSCIKMFNVSVFKLQTIRILWATVKYGCSLEQQSEGLTPDKPAGKQLVLFVGWFWGNRISNGSMRLQCQLPKDKDNVFVSNAVGKLSLQPLVGF